MSYPKDLYEYSDEDLEEEISRRKTYRSKGMCDYCLRPALSTKFCNKQRRHDIARDHAHRKGTV